jgi:hypothetical protein
VRVEYRAPAGCGQESSFVERLLSRSPRIRRAQPREKAVTLVVRITRTARAIRGHVVIDTDGVEASRDVEGDSCESVESALLLVATLAVDPAAAASPPASVSPSATFVGPAQTVLPPLSTPSAPLTPPPPPPRPPPPPPPETEPHEQERPPAEPRQEQGPRSSPTIEAPARPSIPVDSHEGWHFGVWAGGLAEWGIAPTVSPAGQVTVELLRARASPLSPAVELGFLYANSGDEPVTGGGVRMVQSIGTLDVCPLRLLVSRLRFLPCLHGEGGALEASGLDISPSRSQLRPWVAAGLLGRVRFVFSPFFLELFGGASVPLQRDRFFFEPDNTVFHPPFVSGTAGGGLGLTIL